MLLRRVGDFVTYDALSSGLMSLSWGYHTLIFGVVQVYLWWCTLQGFAYTLFIYLVIARPTVVTWVNLVNVGRVGCYFGEIMDIECQSK